MFERRLYYHVDWAMLGAIIALCLIGLAQISSARVAYPLKDVAVIHASRSDPAVTSAVLLAVIVAIAGAVVVTCSLDEQGCMGS